MSIFRAQFNCVRAVKKTHIFFVVISQSKFPLWQHELPLQKLSIVFPLFPQHSFIEAWKPIQTVKSINCHVDNKINIRWAMTESVCLVFLACNYAKNRFCMCMRNNTDTYWILFYRCHVVIENNVNLTCGVRQGWILSFSIEFQPFIFRPNPLLPQDTDNIKKYSV